MFSSLLGYMPASIIDTASSLNIFNVRYIGADTEGSSDVAKEVIVMLRRVDI
jgi:hypothetical protein